MPRNQVIRAARVQSSVQFVVVSVGVKRSKHRLCFGRNDQLVVVQKLYFFDRKSDAYSFPEQS